MSLDGSRSSSVRSEPGPQSSSASAAGGSPTSVAPPSPGSRMSNLPAKPKRIEEKHRKEHREMLERVRLKKLHDEQLAQAKAKAALQREERIREHSRVWQNQVLPNWGKFRGTKKVRSLAIVGVPPKLRGQIWTCAVGNDLRVTPQLFKIFLARAKETSLRVEAKEVKAAAEYKAGSCGPLATDGGEEPKEPPKESKEGSVVLIKLDLPRTFPALSFFQPGSPMFDDLADVLAAYCCYRPDIGYVQGMSYLAAVLLLQMSAEDSFVCLANILNTPALLVFFKMNADIITKYISLLKRMIREVAPKVMRKLDEQNIMLEAFVVDWILTLFSKSLPFEVAIRLWDCFVCTGEVSIFKGILAILLLFEAQIVGGSFEENMHLLTHIPPDFDADRLFKLMGKLPFNDKKFAALQREFVGDTESILKQLGS